MKSISIQERIVLNSLIESNDLPIVPFDITEDYIIAYMHRFVKVFNKKSFNLDTSNYRYIRKLTGMTLMKYNVELGAKVSEIKAGLVYVIENPAFPEHFKIGMTTDLEARLMQYQTADPYRGFKVRHYEFVLDRKHAEKRILNSFEISLENGEWVHRKKCAKVFRSVTSNYTKVLA